jgi:hypothetical protein
VFRTRPRGSLRVAALLAIGVSPLLAGVAAAAPAPSLDGMGDLVESTPELITNLVDRDGNIASGKSVKLPAPSALPEASAVLQQPTPPLAEAVHALPGLPATPALPGFVEERALPASTLPIVDQLPLNQLPINQLPSIDELPIQLLPVSGLPVALPGLG